MLGGVRLAIFYPQKHQLVQTQRYQQQEERVTSRYTTSSAFLAV